MRGKGQMKQGFVHSTDEMGSCLRKGHCSMIACESMILCDKDQTF